MNNTANTVNLITSDNNIMHYQVFNAKRRIGYITSKCNKSFIAWVGNLEVGHMTISKNGAQIVFDTLDKASDVVAKSWEILSKKYPSKYFTLDTQEEVRKPDSFVYEGAIDFKL